MTVSARHALLAAGFKVRVLERRGWKTAAGLGSAYPALVATGDGRWLILVHTVTRDGEDFAAILDPQHEAGGLKLVKRADFEAVWSGEIVLARRARSLAAEGGRFGLRWFVPELLRQRHLLWGLRRRQ